MYDRSSAPHLCARACRTLESAIITCTDQEAQGRKLREQCVSRIRSMSGAGARHLAWLRAGGVRWDEHEIEVRCNSGCTTDTPEYSVHARNTALQKDFLVARIPKRITLGPLTGSLRTVHENVCRRAEAAEGGEEWEIFRDHFISEEATDEKKFWPPACGVIDDFLLPLVVYFELLQRHRSPWWGYLSTISAPPVLATWPAHIQEILEGTDLAGAGEAGHDHIRAFFQENMCPYLVALSSLGSRFGLSRTDSSCLAKGSRSTDDNFSCFMQAVALSKSRGFFVDDEYGEAMVPFADLLNHKAARKPEGMLTTSEEWGSGNTREPKPAQVRNAPGMEAAIGATPDNDDELVVIVLSTIDSGAEILNTYGEHPNANLLYDYGFVIGAQNPFDLIHVSLKLFIEAAVTSNKDLTDRGVRKRLGLLQEHQSDIYQLHRETSVRENHSGLLCLLYVLCADETCTTSSAHKGKKKQKLMQWSLDGLHNPSASLVDVAKRWYGKQKNSRAANTLFSSVLQVRKEGIEEGLTKEKLLSLSLKEDTWAKYRELATAYRNCEREILDSILLRHKEHS